MLVEYDCRSDQIVQASATRAYLENCSCRPRRPRPFGATKDRTVVQLGGYIIRTFRCARSGSFLARRRGHF